MVRVIQIEKRVYSKNIMYKSIAAYSMVDKTQNFDFSKSWKG